MATMTPALIAGVYKWFQLSFYRRLLVIQVFFAIVANLFSSLVSRPNGDVFNCYMIFDFFLVFIAAMDYLPKFFRFSFTLISFTTFVSTWLFSVWKFSVFSIATYALLASALIIAIEYFIGMAHLFLEKGYNRGVFIIFFSTFIYYCGIIPVFSFLNYLIKEKVGQTQFLFNITIGVLSALRYIILAIGFWNHKSIIK